VSIVSRQILHVRGTSSSEEVFMQTSVHVLSCDTGIPCGSVFDVKSVKSNETPNPGIEVVEVFCCKSELIILRNGDDDDVFVGRFVGRVFVGRVFVGRLFVGRLFVGRLFVGRLFVGRLFANIEDGGGDATLSIYKSFTVVMCGE
jgi:hypothetical protein